MVLSGQRCDRVCPVVEPLRRDFRDPRLAGEQPKEDYQDQVCAGGTGMPDPELVCNSLEHYWARFAYLDPLRPGSSPGVEAVSFDAIQKDSGGYGVCRRGVGSYCPPAVRPAP